MCLVVGSTGILGSGVSKHLQGCSHSVKPISGLMLCQASPHEFQGYIAETIEELDEQYPGTTEIGIFLCHRVRNRPLVDTILAEIRLCRDFVLGISSAYRRTNVIVFGSITGTRVDPLSSESYHFGKDIQLTCVRQSIMHPSINMNLLQLYWFRKYDLGQSNPEYEEQLSSVSARLKLTSLPDLQDIADFAERIVFARFPPRGQVLTYDSGLSLLQEC